MRLLPYRFRKSIVKRLAPELIHQGFAYDFTSMDNKRLFGHTRDYIERMMFFCGAYERYMLAFFRDVAEAMDYEVVFFDIGANVGNHVVFLADHVQQVHAFEPHGRLFEHLSKHVEINQISNAKLHPFGLSNSDATLPYYEGPEGNRGAGSFVADHDAGNRHVGDLELHHGDSFVRQHHISSIDLMKIDVEGFEQQVLEGLKESLATYRPIIVTELSPTTRRSFANEQEFYDSFPQDYEFYRFAIANRSNGSYAIRPFDYQAHYKRKDVIACPKEKRHLMRPMHLKLC